MRCTRCARERVSFDLELMKFNEIGFVLFCCNFCNRVSYSLDITNLEKSENLELGEELTINSASLPKMTLISMLEEENPIKIKFAMREILRRDPNRKVKTKFGLYTITEAMSQK